MANKKLQKKGEKLYDNFLEKLFEMQRSEIKASNPSTNALEVFALLNNREDNGQLIGAMCYQLSKDIFIDDIIVKNGKLWILESGLRKYK